MTEQAHTMRLRSLLMLATVKSNLERVVNGQAQPEDQRAILMACHYALMELNLSCAMASGELADPIQVLHDLFEAGGLDDHFYAVREREGQGWEGPRMNRWGAAVEQAHKLLEGYQP